jgi:hypothetical protein
VRWHNWHTPMAQSRRQWPRQRAQARAPCAHLWGQCEALTSHPGRSPLRGCQPHMRRAQMRSQTGSVDAHVEEARVTARDWRAVLARVPHRRWPLSLSLRTKYLQTQRGAPSPHPTRTSRAEVSSPQKGPPNATAPWPWTGAPHWGARPSPSRVGTPQRRTAARGIAALRPRSPTSYTFQHPHNIPFRAPMHLRDHARAARQPPPPPTTPSTLRAITGGWLPSVIIHTTYSCITVVLLILL